MPVRECAFLVVFGARAMKEMHRFIADISKEHVKGRGLTRGQQRALEPQSKQR